MASTPHKRKERAMLASVIQHRTGTQVAQPSASEGFWSHSVRPLAGAHAFCPLPADSADAT